MKRVLLVDDDAAILDALAMALEGAYEVSMAGNGAEALQQIAATRFDVIVLDLMMPILDGAGVMRELSARQVRIPVILVSAARNLAEEAAQLGAADFLSKPFDLEALEAKLACLTGGEAHHC